MGNQNSIKESNEFEKQLNEINEWQNNANNPGHFIGNGKVPAPIKNLSKSPLTMIIIGFVLLIPLIFNLINNFDITFVTANPTPLILVVSIGLIIGGFIRLTKKF